MLYSSLESIVRTMAKRGRKPRYDVPLTIKYNGKSHAIYKRREGRPTKYRVEFLEIVYHARALGKSDTEIIDSLHVSFTLFYQWLNTKPEFREAYNKGKEDIELYASKALHYKLQPKTLIRTEKKQYLDKYGNKQELKTVIEQDIPPDVLALNNYLNRRVKSFRVDLLEDPNTEKVDLLLNALAKLVPDKMQAKLDELKALTPVSPTVLAPQATEIQQDQVNNSIAKDDSKDLNE